MLSVKLNLSRCGNYYANPDSPEFTLPTPYICTPYVRSAIRRREMPEQIKVDFSIRPIKGFHSKIELSSESDHVLMLKGVWAKRKEVGAFCQLYLDLEAHFGEEVEIYVRVTTIRTKTKNKKGK